MKTLPTKGLAFALLFALAHGSGFAAATKFVITGSSAVTAGGTLTLTIQADDAGVADPTYTGNHALTFSGASASTNPVTNPTATDNTSAQVAFGTATTLTFTSGVATTTVRLYHASSDSLSVTDGTLSSFGTGKLYVVVSPAAAAKLAFTTQPGSSTGGVTFSTQPAVTLQDAYGNTVTGTSQNVTLAIQNNAGPGGVLSGTKTLAVNTSSGIATFSGLSIDKVGTGYTLTATGNTVSTTPGVIVSSAFNITAGPATRLQITGTGSQTAGASQNLTITAYDAGGNTATPYTGAKSLTFSGANSSTSPVTAPTVSDNTGAAVNFGTATNITFTNGVATVSSTTNGVMRLYRVENDSIAVTDGTISSTGTDKLYVVVSVGAASKLAFTTQPGSSPSGVAFPTQPAVTLQDAYGNTVTGTAQNVTLAIQNNAGPGGVLSGTKTVAVNTSTGVATFSGLSIDKVGTGYTLTATGNTVSTTPGVIVSSAFNITAGSATRLVITGQATQTAGASQNLTVTAVDAAGNTATSYTGAKSLTFSGANSSTSPVTAPTVSDNTGAAVHFGTATNITFTNGVATVSSTSNGVMRLYRVENDSISVTDGTISSTGTGKLYVVVSPGSLGKFAFVLATPQTNDVAFTGADTLTAQDDWGNIVTSYSAATNSVTLSSTLSGYITGFGASGTSNVMNQSGDFSSGVAILAGKLKFTGTVGSGTFTATSATGGKTGTSGSVTIAAGAARKLVLTGTTSLSAGTANPLTITAKDTTGNTATSYSGIKTLSFTGASASPDATAPEVKDRTGTTRNFSSTPNTPLNFSSGVSTVSGGSNGMMRLYRVGTDTIVAFDGTIMTSGANRLIVTTTPAGLDAFTVTLNSPQTNGIAFTGVNTITAIDTFGNTATSFNASTNNVTITTTHSGTITGLGSSSNNVLNRASDFNSGVANLTSLGMKYTGTVGATGTFTATSASGVKTGVSGNVVINVGAATRLIIGGSASQLAGATQNLTITARDSSGNVATGYTGDKQVRFSGSGPSVNPVTYPKVTDKDGTLNLIGSWLYLTFANGVATVSGSSNGVITLYRAGRDTISITDGTIGSGAGDRLIVTVTEDVLQKFVFALASPQQSGVSFTGTNTLTAQDQYGNTVTTFNPATDNVTVSANSPLTGTVTGLGSGSTNVLNQAGDFSSGVANLTGKMVYTGVTGSAPFTAASVSSKSGISGTVQIVAGGATRLVVTGVTGMTAGGSQSLTISAKDASGNTDPTYTGSKNLVFSGADASPSGSAPTVTNSSGTAIAFGSTTAITFTNGNAVVSGSNNGVLRLYRAQNAIVSATDGTISSSGTDRLTVTVSPGSLGRFAWSLTSPQTNGVAFTGTNTLTAQDDYWNTVTSFNASTSNVTVTTSLSGTIAGLGSSGNNVLNNSSDFASGVADLTALGMRYTGTVGTGTFTATSAGRSGASSSVVISAGSASRLVLRAASGDSVIGLTAGLAQNLLITAKDASGNTVTSYTGSRSLTFTGADSSISGSAPTVSNASGTAVRFGVATSITFTSGVASVSGSTNGVMRLYKAQNATVSVTDGTRSSTGNDRLTVTVSPASLQQFAWVLATSQTNGAPFSGTNTLTAQDTYRNTLTSFDASSSNVTITTSLSGSITGLGSSSNNVLNRAADFSSGIADLTALGMTYTGSAGRGVFTATSAGRAGTSDSVDIGSGGATRLVITGTTTQVAGTAQSLTITARDASGNMVSSYTGSKTLTFSGANASTNPVTAPTVTNVSGSAVAFGSATAINFTNGVATVAGGANGAMRLYRVEGALISVTDGSIQASGSDRLSVAVSYGAIGQFAVNLTSPQINAAAFAGTNTIVAQDDWGNTVTSFSAATDNVRLTTTLPGSPSAITGLGSLGNNVLNRAGDFASGVANLTSLGMRYTGIAGSGTFTATSGATGKTGTSASVTINNPVPTLTGVSPNDGSRLQQRDIVLTGTNILSGVTVANFGADITVDTTIYTSSSQMTVRITIGAGAVLGLRNVSITNTTPGGGTGTLSNGFTVKNVPTIASVSPSSGVRGETKDIIITGTNFTNGVSTVGIVGSGIAVNSTDVTTPSTIRANITISLSATDGIRQFFVTNSDPYGGTSNNIGFTIGSNPTPKLTSVSPDTAERLQTLELTLKGTDFYGGITSVNLGPGITVSGLVIDSIKQMRVTAAVSDTAATGRRNIMVTNASPGGGTDTLKNAFTIVNPVPTVTGLSAQNGTRLQSTSLTLTGTHFIRSATTVSLGAGITMETPIVDSPTQIRVNFFIDSSAALGARNISVTTPAPKGGTATLSSAFTISNPVPTITSVAPESVMVKSSATNITITGTNFVVGSAAYLGSTALTTTLVSRTRLTASIPASLLDTAQSFAIAVTNPAPGGGTTNTKSITVLNPAPTLTSILPVSGSRLQTVNVVFKGKGFVTGFTQPNFGGTDITVNSATVNSDSQLTANITISALATIGARDVTVSNPSPGGGVSAKQTFTIANNPAPTFTAINPSAGNRLSSFDVVISGTNFITGVTSVDFGAGITTGTPVINSSTQLTVHITISVSAATGARSVSVTNAQPGGGTATRTNSFTVNNPAPTLTTIDPSNGQQLETKNIVFYGTGFISASVTRVDMGTGISINSQNVVSDSQMTANVTITTNAATGPRDVYVTNLGPGGGSATLTNGFVVGNNPAPHLTSISPATARRLELVNIVFRGSNFMGGVTTVDFGSDITVNSVTVNSDSQLTANVLVLPTAATGSRNVRINNAAPGGGTDSLVSALAITNPLPTVTSITPSSARQGETPALVVRGSNFINGTTTVTFATGSKITVRSTTVDSAAARMTVNITIDSTATPGAVIVSVENPTPGGGKASSSFTVVMAPPSTPVLVSPGNGQTFLPTNPVLRWRTTAAAASYYLQLSTSTLFAATIVNDSTLADTSRRVSALTNGQTYYWRVRAKNSGGISPWSDIWSFRPDYPTTITLNDTVQFPLYDAANNYTSTDWKMVGLPGASTTLIASRLQGSQKTDWQVYTDNGATGTTKDYLVVYNGTSDFTFANGKAFWLIRKGNWAINFSVDAAPLDDSAAVRIALHRRWNLITNPFDKTVQWSLVQSFNSRSTVGPIYAYKGASGFVTSSTLDPYVGYYYDNTDSSNYLSIPYGAVTGVLKADSVQEGEWTVNVEARSGEYTDRSMSFGTHVDAREGLDRYDYRKPRAMGTQLGIAFERPGLDADYSTFATDFRPPVEKVSLWPFEATAPHKGAITLKFEGIGQIPAGLQAFLIDYAGSRYADLKAAKEYTFTPGPTSSQFAVAVGTHEAIAAALSDVLPKVFGLDNNFPNPFNPTTTIPVLLPNAADVRLVIYNILGEEIRTVFSGTLDAGRHWMVWDGKNGAGRMVASGVYFVRLTGPQGVNVVKKMMMMK
jgi:hypothetical protein